MTETGTGWEGILEPDERILWQGQPHGGVDWSGLVNPMTLMGVFFTGFSAFWIVMAFVMTAGTGAPFPVNFFPLFGLPFLLVGLWMLGGRLVVDAWLRRRTWYTLTSKTAFIARDVFGRKTLESWPLQGIERLSWQDGTPGSILFHMANGAGRHRGRGAPVRLPGFHQIDGSQEVYGLMRKARRELREQDA